MQLLLLVEERSAGLYPGFAATVKAAIAQSLVKTSPRCTDTVRVPCDLVLTTAGQRAVDRAGCTRKVGFITRDVYCGKHGLKAGWPCRGETPLRGRASSR